MKYFYYLIIVISPQILLGQEFDDPVTTADWNLLWKSGFYQSYNISNSPEPNNGNWFWGLNMNHSSNHSGYRYNGQIAIKNSHQNPIMYFRSTDVNGLGVWAKVIHSVGSHTISGDLAVGGDLTGNSIVLDDPVSTTDWNDLWKSGFYQSYNAVNAPEPNNGNWFWGINMNHSSNHDEYRYNGQIAIKNSHQSPTMYFRSTDVQGNGTWAKVLHSHGLQSINGGLTVDGNILAEKVKVQVVNPPDYVFDNNYTLRTLDEVKTFIAKKGHLPEIPSAKEMELNGIELSEMNMNLLKKVEELTLYTIDQEKRIKKQDKLINDLLKRLEKLEKK
ncbi:hypothetical protein BFP97_19035 [Roseivirga sp. 4D4]|uniref:pyocin knob domain-containing protein n=1 Tax=Roseivirga sp. 4D4 TaxID=1889784 RepID=UPI000852CF48|nr:pyocin knob domain-containing protein [Roseivirga sp. 4D4]OEK03485.1 hypothetical protein BFP97_19035 [Roseivirga sp. 4D4]